MESNSVLSVICRKAPPTNSRFLKLVREFRELVRNRRQTRSQTDYEQDPGCAACSGVSIDRRATVNTFGYANEHRLLLRNKHNALQLSDEIEDFLKCPMRYATIDEQRASQEFRSLLENTDKDSVISRLGRADTSLLDHLDFGNILDLLGRCFFPGALLFKFNLLPVKSPHLGQCSTVDGYAHVEMRPRDYTPAKRKFMPKEKKYKHITEAAMGRLNTLLHEAVHAFIQTYACQGCPTHKKHVEDLNGHGNVWQRIACWVKYAAPLTIGIPLKLGRFEAIQVH